MKKRLLSILLVIVMVLTSMPTFAMAADSALQVSTGSLAGDDTVTVTYKIPNSVDLGMIELRIGFDKTKLEATEVVWTSVSGFSAFIGSDATEANANGYFAGSCYSASFTDVTVAANQVLVTATFKIKEDAAPGSAAFSVDELVITDMASTDKSAAAGTTTTGATVTVVSELTGTLAITGVTAPVKNQTPVAASDVTAPANTTITKLEWTPAHATFAAEETYTATLNIKANDGYVFADGVAFTVDGAAWTAAKQDDGTYNLTYTFPKTAGKDALTGTPTISGTVKVGETLTAVVTGLSDSTNITYQWCADGTDISVATSGTYKLTANEAGKTITVKVTATGASQYTGTVTSAATAAVANAAQAAPTLQNSDITATTDTTITVTANNAWEYSKDGSSWQSSNVFTGLNPDTTYNIYVRLMAKTGYDASPASNAISGKTTKAQIAESAKGTLAGYTGTYDGAAHDAITGAPADGYTVQYSTTSADSGFSSTMPKVTNVVDSGKVWVKLSKTGYEDKVFEFTTSVSAKNISSADITLGTQETYTGSAQNVVITSVTVDGKTLTKDTDYTITSGSSAINVAATTLTITGKGNYTDTASTQWTLQKATPVVGDFTVTPPSAVTYGSAVSVTAPTTTKNGMGAVSVKYNGETTAPTYVGSYTVTFDVAEGDNYKAATGLSIGTLTINPAAQTITATSATQTIIKNGVGVDISGWASSNAPGATLTYSLDGTPAGITLAGTTLTAANDASTVSSFTIKVNSGAVNEGGDTSNEFNAATEATITVTVTNKETAALTVTQTGCEYGETLAAPTYTAPDGTIGTPVITYNGTLDKGGSYSSTTAPTEAGTYTVTVKCETSTHIYEGTSASFTIAPKNISGMTVTLSDSTKEYSGSAQTVTVSSVGALAASDYDVSGAVSGTNVGDYTVTVTGKGNYTGTASATWKITPKAITISGATATNRGYAKDDKSVVISGVTFSGATLTKDTDYTVTGVMDDANAGTGKNVNVTVVLTNSNYSLANATATTTVDIAKASAQTLSDITDSFKYTVTSGEKAVGTAGMPADAGTLEYVKGTAVTTGSVTVSSWVVDATGKVTYTLSGGAENDTITLPVTIKSTNYADSVVNVKLTLTAKDGQAALNITSGTTVVYGNTLNLTVSGGSGTGDVTYTVTNGTGEATISGNVLTATKAGEVTVVATKAGDDDYNEVSSTPVTITISKATPTGTPGYTAITTSGKTLGDAALTVGTITPADGTIAWDLGDAQTVSANTAYAWTYIPADTTNYNVLTGTIKPYVVSTGGGGGGGSVATYAIVVEDSDNGEISASKKSASKGTDITLTVKADEGYELDTLKVLDKNGDKVKVTKKGDKYTFEMPASKVTVKATFSKIDVEPTFDDVAEDAYYFVPVEWAVEEGITSGTSATTFSPNASCTRAQAVTFLWRAAGSPEPESTEMPFEDVADGAYYYDAVLWAVENGITAGTSATTFAPNATCTRAQIVTFLWRSQKSPAGETVNPFADVAAGAYYYDAVLWAVENGVTAGTTATTFSPNNNCTRAQIVTFLYRALNK